MARQCYCGLWKTSPDTLRSQGIPPGYCGLCQTCGKPGHTRHFPGSAPYTGSWCDRHFRLTAWLHPLGEYGARLYLAAAVIAMAVILLRR